MKRKKTKKWPYPAVSAVKGIGVGTLGLAAGGVALGAVGGNIAAHGQTGLLNVSRMAPAAGSIMGAGMVVKSVDWLDQPLKKRRRR